MRVAVMVCLLVSTCVFAEQEPRVRVHYNKEGEGLGATEPTKRVVAGFLESLSASQMVLRLKDKRERIPLGAIKKVEQFKGEKTKIKKGVLVGCGLGAVGFLVAATGQDFCLSGGDAEASCQKLEMRGATSLAVISVVGGAIIGYADRTEMWEPTTISLLREVSWKPMPDRLGLAVKINF